MMILHLTFLRQLANIFYNYIIGERGGIQTDTEERLRLLPLPVGLLTDKIYLSL